MFGLGTKQSKTPKAAKKVSTKAVDQGLAELNKDMEAKKASGECPFC